MKRTTYYDNSITTKHLHLTFCQINILIHSIIVSDATEVASILPIAVTFFVLATTSSLVILVHEYITTSFIAQKDSYVSGVQESCNLCRKANRLWPKGRRLAVTIHYTVRGAIFFWQ